MKKLGMVLIFLMMTILGNEGKGAEYLIYYYVKAAPPKIGSVSVSPQYSEIKTNSTATFTAILYTEMGGTFTDRMVQRFNRGSITWSWTVSDGTVTPIGGKGTQAIYMAPNSEGTYTIYLNVEEPPVEFQDPIISTLTHTISTETIIVSASSTIRVITPKPTNVDLEPESIVLLVAGTATVRVLVKDQWGNLMPEIIGTFTTNIGTLSPTIGTQTTFNAQTQTGAGWVVVEVNGLSATSTITLTPGPLSTVLVIPEVATLTLNGTQTFRAQGYDAYGNLREDDIFQWEVEDTSLGTLTVLIGTRTLFTATNTGIGGTTTIKAEKGGIVGDVLIVVVGNFIKYIPNQKAGVPFGIEVNIAGFEGEGSLMTPLEGFLGTISVEGGKGKGTVTLYKADTQQLIVYDSFATLTSNNFVVDPGKIATFTLSGMPGIIIPGRASDYYTITVTFLDEWGNKALIPPKPPSHSQMYAGGVLVRNNIPDNDSVDILRSCITYHYQNKAFVIPGRKEISFPGEEGFYKTFFKQSFHPQIDRLITEGENDYIRLFMRLEISNY